LAARLGLSWAYSELTTAPASMPRGGRPMTDIPRFGWKNGRIVPWDECVLHIRAQGAFYGANVFEGVRAYWNAEQGGLYRFKLREHLDRLARSMKTMRLDVPVSLEASVRG